MIVKINDKGIVENIQSPRFIQGSSYVNKISLFAPFQADYYAMVNMKLPNGNYSKMLNEVGFQEDGYRCWQLEITNGITKHAGQIQLAFQLGKDDKIIKTPIIKVTIEESIDEGLELEDPNTFNELWRLINSKADKEDIAGLFNEEGKIKLDLLPHIDCGSW